MRAIGNITVFALMYLIVAAGRLIILEYAYIFVEKAPAKIYLEAS